MFSWYASYAGGVLSLCVVTVTFPPSLCCVRGDGPACLLPSVVVQVFHSAGESVRRAASFPVPLEILVDFARVSVAQGASGVVDFTITEGKCLFLTTHAHRGGALGCSGFGLRGTAVCVWIR
jgi:hypothetical protein